MKKIVLGLMCVVSFIFAETPNNIAKRILTNANNVYEMDLKQGKCVEYTEERRKKMYDMWLQVPALGLPYDFSLIRYEKEPNPKYVFLGGIRGSGVAIYMINKSECNRLFRKDNIEFFQGHVEKTFNYLTKILSYDDYIKQN